MVSDSLFEVLEFEVGVELCRIQVPMAEQLLHVPEAGAATQEITSRTDRVNSFVIRRAS